MRFLFGNGSMFHASRHDYELSLLNHTCTFRNSMWNRPFTARNLSSSLEVVMPDELTLAELHMLSVEFGDDVGLPVFLDLLEFLLDVQLIHDYHHCEEYYSSITTLKGRSA